MAAAVYRPTDHAPWQDTEIIGRHWPSGAYVLCEVGKKLPGIWLGYPDQVRLPVGVIEQPAIERRNLPPMTAQQRWKYRTIREVAGRETALQSVLEP